MFWSVDIIIFIWIIFTLIWIIFGIEKTREKMRIGEILRDIIIFDICMYSPLLVCF